MLGSLFSKKFISFLFSVVAILRWKKEQKEGISIFRKKNEKKKRKIIKLFLFEEVEKRGIVYIVNKKIDHGVEF